MNYKKIWHSFRLLVCKDGYERANYIKAHKLFGHIGENCYFHPYWMPGDPKSIYMYNNVKIASNVTFITHDIANSMLNVKNCTDEFQYYLEPIEIFDNVLIGTNTTILPGKKIGPNCIVGGTVVSKDVATGTVVVGNPMRVIGKFENFEERRRAYKRENHCS